MAYELGDVLVRAVMENVTGLPEDRVTNDFAFKTGATAPTQTEIDDCIALVDYFYRGVPGAGINIPSSYISETINRAATHLIEVYSITALGLGSPIYSEPWLGPVTAGFATNLPNEVAAVLSFHATLVGTVEEGPGGTRPRARRRGRIYFGPLGAGALDMADPNPRLNADFLTVLRTAGGNLRDGSALEGTPWCVWSRVDEELRVVTGGWTDDEPDTQRRRGNTASTRVTWGNP